MTQYRWPLLVALICLPVALLAAGVRIPGVTATAPPVAPRPVPDGDQEIVWFHTTTGGTNWERFVAGVQRAGATVPGLSVDVSAAFLERTTAAPEVVIGFADRPGKIRIRWYKLHNDAPPRKWVEALARRSPAPLAFIGGGSSDRAIDLACALDAQQAWHGDRPLLLLTTATADTVHLDPDAAGDRADPAANLIDVYDDRSFRFCFTNRQMAEAVTDFLWQSPGLRPRTFAATAPLAVCSGAAAATHRDDAPPAVFNVFWDDDPYSFDLSEQFQTAVARVCPADRPATGGRWRIPYSVGGFLTPNVFEAEAAESLADQLRAQPSQRSVLVLPAVAGPARRFLRAVCEAYPLARYRLVAVNGDAVSVNTVLRDGEIAWPVHSLTVPLVLFTHNDPVGWDTDVPADPTRPNPDVLSPPSSTEDVLHFAELIRVVADAAYPAGGGPVARADDLAARMRGRTPPFFDENGNRLGGTGEYVVVLRPRDPRDAARSADATLDVYRRTPARTWQPTRSVPVFQTRRWADPRRAG